MPSFSLPGFGEGGVGSSFPRALELKKDPTLPSPKSGRESVPGGPAVNAST
jgi:hypothetical protein